MKAFLFCVALVILITAMLSDGFSKKASVWRTLFRIARTAEATSPYRRH